MNSASSIVRVFTSLQEKAQQVLLWALMDLYPVEALPLLSLFLLIIPLSITDLSSDKAALLKFVASVPQGRKLNWRSKMPVCTSWVGVSFSGKRVTMLRLSGIRLYGPIPPNTLGNLDALAILSLHSNFLNGSLPSDLLSLPSLSNIKACSTGYM
nr:probable inactive receptor kinase At5g58300 [Tanacetum cinerariifolium]